MTDKYENERTALRGYAKDVGQEASPWGASANNLKGAKIDSLAFTSSGGKIAANYERLVNEYSWYAWRIGVTLHNIGTALNETANNYGDTEKKIKDDITKLGESF